MEAEDFKNKVAEILKDNITFSGQIGSYVIHGALEKIWELHLSAAMELQLPVKFLQWQIDNRYVWNGVKFVAAWNNYKEYTVDELYKVFEHEYNSGLSLYKIMTNECAGCGRHVNHCVCP